MSLVTIANLIPAEYRKEILELNIIEKAVAIAGDPNMDYLSTIWKDYIEPDFEPDCPLCFTRVLKNFKNLKPTLIELEKNSKLLDFI